MRQFILTGLIDSLEQQMFSSVRCNIGYEELRELEQIIKNKVISDRELSEFWQSEETKISLYYNLLHFYYVKFLLTILFLENTALINKFYDNHALDTEFINKLETINEKIASCYNPGSNLGTRKMIGYQINLLHKFGKKDELKYKHAYLRYFWETPDLRAVKRAKTNHQKFMQIFNDGKSLFDKGYYIQALSQFQEASKIYAPKKLAQLIALCQAKSQEEKRYEQQLAVIKSQIQIGKLQETKKQLSIILTKFKRQDGEDILRKLEKVINGKEAFKRGLKAEKNQQWLEAEQKYKIAIEMIPELTEATVRLGIVAIKQQKYALAIERLIGLTGKEVIYWRGYAYAQQKQWQQSLKEWENISDLAVQEQVKIIEQLKRREQLQSICDINQAVGSNQLEAASTMSLAYLAKFGTDASVESNLANHILPRLDAQIWENKNWSKISQLTEQQWLKKQDIMSLHNWNVALYYHYLESKKTEQLAKLIASWSTAIANIKLNCMWENLPWLNTSMINWEELTTNLQLILETSIDSYKDTQIETYYQLRDCYRRELLAIKLIIESPDNGVKIGNLVLTPECYNRYQAYFSSGNLPRLTISNTLYTDWGLAIAACIGGDRPRGLKLKPQKTPQGDAEEYAEQFLAYQSGCHHLQQKQWQKAIEPLKQAQNLITASPEWLEEVNQLCQSQCQELDDENLNLNLEFAIFWQKLLATPEANSFVTQLKVRQISTNLEQETINEAEAIQQLKQLEKSDPDNPLILNLLEIVQQRQELLEIWTLIDSGKFEEAIIRAKQSKDSSLKNKVAHLCLEILLEGLKNQTFSLAEAQKLALWAYQLDPEDDHCLHIYQSLSNA
jgi:hypothetical protein